MNIEEARKNLKVGDLVHVDGYGCDRKGYAVRLLPDLPWAVIQIRGTGGVVIGAGMGVETGIDILPHSIIEVIPAEPKPKVGEWRCSREFTNLHEPSKGEYFICKNCKVYRTEGWSYNERLFGRNDRRTGDRRKK